MATHYVGADESSYVVHPHRYDPVEASTGERLDVTSRSPKQAALFERVYRHSQVGTLICARCDDSASERYLYVRIRHGKREVCQYSPAHVANRMPESPEHHALKDAICTLAEQRGLRADQEEAGHHRRTDVVVSGGDKPVGWEVELNHLTPNDLNRRIDAAVRDGLMSSWLSMQLRPAWATLIKQAPATATREMRADEIQRIRDPRIVGGIKRITLERCGAQRGEQWHRELKCTGWHGRPAALDPEEHPRLSSMVEQTAAGRLVSFRWPRKIQRYGRYWLLVPSADVARFNEAERPFLERIGAAPADDVDEPTKPADHVPSHATMIKQDWAMPTLDLVIPTCPAGCEWARANDAASQPGMFCPEHGLDR